MASTGISMWVSGSTGFGTVRVQTTTTTVDTAIQMTPGSYEHFILIWNGALEVYHNGEVSMSIT